MTHVFLFFYFFQLCVRVKYFQANFFFKAAVSYCKQEKKIKAKIFEHDVGELEISRIQIDTGYKLTQDTN